VEIAALRGEPVDVRRAGVFIAGVATGVVAELVGEYIDEVRPLGCGSGGTDARRGARQEGPPGDRHIPDYLPTAHDHGRDRATEIPRVSFGYLPATAQ